MNEAKRNSAQIPPQDDGVFDLAPAPSLPPPPKMSFENGFPVSESVGRAVLQRDVPCGNCGYNLRGLPRNGRCPECGRNIKDSLYRDDRLELCQIEWVRTLCWGLWILLAGLLIFGVAGAAVIAREDQIAMLAIPAAALMATGLWLITTREAAENEPMQPIWPLRILARRGLLLGVVLIGGTFCLITLSGYHVFWQVLAKIMMGITLLCLAMTTFSAGFYLQDIARRVPDDKLSRWFLNITWGIGGSFLVTGCSLVLATVTGQWVLFFTTPVLLASVPLYLLATLAVLALAKNVIAVIQTHPNKMIDNQE